MSVGDAALKVLAAPGALQARTVQEFLEHSRHLMTEALGFPNQHVTDFQYYIPKQIFCMAHKATQDYVDAGLARIAPPRTVIGLREKSTIEWVVSFVAAIRMGYTVLLLSPTLPANKVKTLMDQAECSMLIDGTIMTDGTEAQEFTSTLQAANKTVIPMTRLESLPLYANGGSAQEEGDHDDDGEKQRWSHINETDIAVILHSTGSTGLPKLIPKTHTSVLNRLRGLPAMLHDASFIGSSLYSSVGFHSMIFSFVKAGGPSVWANARMSLNAPEYRDTLIKVQPRTAWFNPTGLLAAMSTPEGLEVLKQCDVVVTTGHVFPTQLGDKLVQGGVRLVNIYGMSELSPGVRLISASRKRGDPDWQYLEPDPTTAPHVQFQIVSDLADDQGSKMLVHELVVLPSHPTQDKCYANQSDGSFRTGDLFLQHPTRPGCYRCIGRMSDEVKIRPWGRDRVGVQAVPYEHAAMSGNDHLLQEVVMFGNDRPEPGFLLFTKPGCDKTTDYIAESAWKALQHDFAKGVLPMAVERNLLVVVRNAVVPRTPKGNIVRPEIYLSFEKVINDAYGE
ncbi:hypothetical protein BJ170DRAFT_724701 [Xylariales sp. AK1849]|nr:hypothetical protein BJ170DRAFT_724701 [Xylariales sp. AK1849]